MTFDEKFILKMYHSDAQFYASVRLVTFLRKIPEEKILQQLNKNLDFLVMLNRREALRRKLSDFLMRGIGFNSNVCEPMWDELIETERILRDSVLAAVEEAS